MLPVRALFEKSKEVSFVKLPKEAGILPQKVLEPRDKKDNSANLENEDGMFPSS